MRCPQGACACAIAVGATLPGRAWTQSDTTSPPRLRLDSLYAAAARANPRVMAAGALADAALARVPGARRPPDPQLQFGLMNRELPGLGPMDPLGMTQLQLMQMIPTAGKLGLMGAAAEARSTSARARALDLRWEVRSQVAAAFYDVYRADRSLAIATKRLMEDVAATADAMYRVGETAQADVLKARVEVARMSEEIVAMRAMRLVGLARLSGLLDQPVDSGLPTAQLTTFPDSVDSPDALMREAASIRPMVRAGEADLDAATAEQRRAWREIWVGRASEHHGGTTEKALPYIKSA